MTLTENEIRAHRALTAERNLFLTAFAVATVVGIAWGSAFHFTSPGWEEIGGFAVLLTAAAKALFVYAVYRLSRFLRQPVWLTLPYCILAPLAGFYLIPSVLLLIDVRRARSAI